MNFAPVSRAYKKPLHAALKSNAHAFFASILFCTIAAVEGVGWSGVTVPMIITSISLALIPLFSKSEFATLVDMSEEASFSATTCLCLIPTLL